MPASAVVARVPAPRPSRSARILMLQAKVLAQDGALAAATAICAELALLTRCERVSLGLGSRARMRVFAISGATDIRPRQSLVRALAAAMEEAADQAAPALLPAPRGEAPRVTLALAELRRIGGQAVLYAVPIRHRERAVGALVFEAGVAFEPSTLELARDAALLVGPLLDLRRQAERGLRWPGALGAVGGARQQRTRAGGLRHQSRPIVAATVLVLLTLAVWPVSEQVVAPARIEGSIQRVLAAPVDGFVREVGVRPGDKVHAGQMLLGLDDRELILERERAAAELAQVDKVYGEALAQDDAGPIALARARIEQARSQLALAEEQLARSRLTAPFDGIVIQGDLIQSIGMPVRRGQELMTVAPDQGFRAVIETDEQDIAGLREGQTARILFAAWTDDPVEVTIERIAPVATVIGDRNVFESEAQVVARDSLRPGLRGVARIDIGRRMRAAILYDRGARWLRRIAWRLLG